MKTKLPVRPIPFSDESPLGLLIRTAEVNGYPNVRALAYAYLGQRCSQSWLAAAATHSARYQFILNRLGIEVTDTAQSTHFHRAGPTRKSPRILDGLAFIEQLFRDDGQFYCPLCLRDQGYWRKHWLLRTYPSCLEHKVYLCSGCHTCGARLDTWRGRVDHCHACNARLSEAPTVPTNTADLAWWLGMHRAAPDLAITLDEIYVALCQIDGDNYEPVQEERRLNMLRRWIDEAAVDPWLPALLRDQAALLHPRIQMLPLLGLAQPAARAFAKSVLEAIGPVTSDGMPRSLCGYLNNRDVELALGIRSSHLKHFFARGLFRDSGGEYCRRGQVWLGAVNDILFQMQGDTASYCDGVARPVARSLAAVVADVVSGSSISVGYGIGVGLTSLRLKTKLISATQPATNTDWLGLPQIAEQLGTYFEAARHLLKRGWIPYRSRDLSGAKRMIARREDVELFARQYILTGTLAKQINENPTNLAERLMALGMKAVGGPSIDGMLVYIFRQVDIKRIDTKLLHGMMGYATHTGRKPMATSQTLHNREACDISAQTAAELLNISHGEVLTLVHSGQLAVSSGLHRNTHIIRVSLRALSDDLHRSDRISVDAAAARLGISVATLDAVWATSGMITIHDHVLWRRVSIAEVEKLEALMAEFITAKNAGEMLGTHRSHLPNIERRGEASSVVVGVNRQLRLYRRVDIEELRNRSDHTEKLKYDLAQTGNNRIDGAPYPSA